jgi:hypothetical protein
MSGVSSPSDKYRLCGLVNIPVGKDSVRSKHERRTSSERFVCMEMVGIFSGIGGDF